MKIGVVFPTLEVPPDRAMIKDFAQAIEGMGYDHIIGYDHVLGADVTNRPDWATPFTNKSKFYEPLVLFGFLAGVTDRLELATGVLVLPARQTALVAKQVSILDILTGGRLRLGIGVGYNPVEFEALGVPLEGRGPRTDEQMDLLREFWTKDSVSFAGAFHTVSEAGLCPAPAQRPIPLWVGGAAKVAVKRAAYKSDGWMIPSLPPSAAEDSIGSFYELVKEAGRDPATVGVENIMSAGTTRGGHSDRQRGPDEVAADCHVWKKAGASHVSIHSMDAGLSYPSGHIDFFQALRNSL